MRICFSFFYYEFCTISRGRTCTICCQMFKFQSTRCLQSKKTILLQVWNISCAVTNVAVIRGSLTNEVIKKVKISISLYLLRLKFIFINLTISEIKRKCRQLLVWWYAKCYRWGSQTAVMMQLLSIIDTMTLMLSDTLLTVCFQCEKNESQNRVISSSLWVVLIHRPWDGGG